MLEVFLAMIAWFIFCAIIAEVGPPLIEALGAAFEFLAEVLWEGIKGLVRGLFWLIAALFRLLWRAAVLAGRGTGFTCTFLFYLAVEWMRGEPADEAAFESEDEADSEELYQAALRLLGLADDFTRAALDAAFKRAMKRAHPDVGGSVDEAQAVNTARDLLMRRRGWA